MHRRPADGDEAPALYVHQDYPIVNDRTQAMLEIVDRAVITVQWATTQVQLEGERAERVSQQEKRSASLGRGGSQSVSGFTSSHAEE